VRPSGAGAPGFGYGAAREKLPPMSIRTRLLLLVFAVWLPAMAGFGLLARATYVQEARTALGHVRDAARALSLIERHKVTHGQFVATMFVRMLKLPEADRVAFDTSSLRLVVHTAAPVSVEVKEQMIAWLGPILTEFYAGSEGNGFCMIDSPAWLRHKGSVGKPIAGAVHICSDDGDELPEGEIGTVWFSGTRRFSYHNDPAKTAGVYNDKGWSTLGDMGHLDAEGYLYLADRRTDLILSGGVNIYPREIEDALALHPAVADIVVLGIPDEEMGQRVHAVV